MQKRLIIAAVSLFLALIFITILSFALVNSSIGTVLLDRSATSYPFTIQNLMWMMFFFGVGELIARLMSGIEQQNQMTKSFLPEDESSLLQSSDLGPIIKRLNQDKGVETLFLQRLLKRTILQFQSSRSIDQANSLMNSTMELYQHETDMKYSMVRYLVWLIPTLGFIGTIIGISKGLAKAKDFPGIDVATAADPSGPNPIKEWIGDLTTELAVAFDTTLLALILSAILVFMLHMIQEKEEMSLNKIGHYCMDNLITRLYEK